MENRAQEKQKIAPKKARRITPEYLHNAALYYLQRYAASTGRVRHILTQKIKRSCRDHPDQVLTDLLPLVEVEIITLIRVELLADEKVGAQLVSGFRARGMSARNISIKLQQRGFDKALIAHLLTDSNEINTISTEIDAATRYLKRRRLGPFAVTAPDDRQAIQKNRQKTWAALARLGYDQDVIEAAMKG